jgi:hypothetical protein
MMATTFERVREQSTTNYMFLTSMVVVSFTRSGIVPPPLLVLGLPYYAVCFCRSSHSTFPILR